MTKDLNSIYLNRRFYLSGIRYHHVRKRFAVSRIPAMMIGRYRLGDFHFDIIEQKKKIKKILIHNVTG